MATMKVLKEVVELSCPKDSWHFALQQVAITYSDGRTVEAYRFVCREGVDKDGHEAHFPSLADAETLIQLAKEAGWDNEKGLSPLSIKWTR